MGDSLKNKYKRRERTIFRVRKNIKGTETCPRVHLTKTNKHLYAQVIDDCSGNVAFGVSTVSHSFKSCNDGKIGSRTKESAEILGSLVGNFISNNKISSCKFDRRWSKYHGVLKSFADKVREISPVF